jgi:pimeloyl-ACP methyl ester carboxylesterase
MIKWFKKLTVFAIALLVHALVFPQPFQTYPTDTDLFGRNEIVGEYANINGIRLYYEIYGTGEPLLMIHGNGGSINDFINQVPYFSKKYMVILADSRSQGKSVDTGDSLSFEMMADDFSALLDELHIDSCHVLGWSDGGINGLMLAIHHPEKVKKLAITGANLWPDSTAICAADYLRGLNYYDTLGKMPQTPENINNRKLVKLDMFQPHLSRQQLKEIACPVLVIGGDHDIIPPEHTLLIARWIPGAYLWILPNSSHSTLIDYRDQFNRTVDEFFKGSLRK